MSRLAVLLALATAAIAIACADDIPVSTPPEPRTAQSELQPAQPAQQQARATDAPLRGDIYTYRNVRHFADEMLNVLAEERVWCDEQPEVAELRAMLDDHEKEEIWRSLLIPAEGEDLRAVRIIAEATA